MITDYINPIIFFVALFVGIFIAYITVPVPDIVIKYPTPENAGKIVYRDSADVCYKYKANIVKCPKEKDKKQSQPMPIQHISMEDKKGEGVFTTMGKWMN